MLVGRYNKTPAFRHGGAEVLKQRLPPNNKGADEGPCVSNCIMSNYLNDVNYLRLGREVCNLPFPFFLRCGFGGLVRNNCTVST